MYENNKINKYTESHFDVKICKISRSFVKPSKWRTAYRLLFQCNIT